MNECGNRDIIDQSVQATAMNELNIVYLVMLCGMACKRHT